MNIRDIRLKCIDLTNKAASRLNMEFTGHDKEPFMVRAGDIFEYATEKGADTEVRLKCAEVALNTVTRRGFMNDLLFEKMKMVETFVLEVKTEAKAKPQTSVPRKPRGQRPGTSVGTGDQSGAPKNQ